MNLHKPTNKYPIDPENVDGALEGNKMATCQTSHILVNSIPVSGLKAGFKVRPHTPSEEVRSHSTAKVSHLSTNPTMPGLVRIEKTKIQPHRRSIG